MAHGGRQGGGFQQFVGRERVGLLAGEQAFDISDARIRAEVALARGASQGLNRWEKGQVMPEQERKPTLKVGVEWIPLEITSEPYVVMTVRGFAPVVDVKSPQGEFILYISSKSMSDGLERMLHDTNGAFKGVKLKVKKESEDKMARYIVEKQ
jgi:hypothetical protein